MNQKQDIQLQPFLPVMLLYTRDFKSPSNIHYLFIEKVASNSYRCFLFIKERKVCITV